MKRFTEEEKTYIREQAALGISALKMAVVLNRAASTLYAWMKNNDVSKPKPKQLTFEFPKEQYQRFLSLNERKYIHECLTKNINISYIARQLNRPYKTIQKEILRNGGPQLYDANKAEELSRLTFRKKKHVFNENDLLTRIDNLEMQIEILFDIIKELKGTQDDQNPEI